MQSLQASKGSWTLIALDFIIKLLKSKELITKVLFDSILVIIDRLIKYGYFILYREASSAKELAYVFLKYVVANHGMLKKINSDCNKLFMSKFWKSLVDQLGMNHKFSTTYHLQTDRQTEQLNQILEQYLQCFVNYCQNDWVSLLPLGQLAYNSAKMETIAVSLFYANYGYHSVTTRKSRWIAEIA